MNIENARRSAKILEDAGFECSTIRCDLGSRDDILSQLLVRRFAVS